MIRKTTRRMTGINATRRPVTAGSSITSSVRNRQAKQPITASNVQLTPQQAAFVRQLKNTARRQSSITAATNTSNIMARPDFLELLPMFVQKLLILDVFGSVAMRSRQQVVPYFKCVAENSKGVTSAGTVLSSPFANRQGVDPNFSGRAVKNEVVGDGDYTAMYCNYTPVLPGSVTVSVNIGGAVTPYTDDAAGNLLDTKGDIVGYINYSDGLVAFTNSTATDGFTTSDTVKASYQYDNETIGPDVNGNYGAKMAKVELQLDEFNLVAQAHELACYWSIYSAFAAQQEYGSNIGDIAKEAAFSELTAEINTNGFKVLESAAATKPQFNWDASAVLSGSVVPSDYLNMFKLKLGQAAASIYQTTRLARPNRLVVGTNVAEYVAMINGFQSAGVQDSVGPYKLGKLDNFEIYVEPTYDPDKWVMCCKSNDIRRNSALFGEYMPLTNTDPIGLANASVQQGYATMYAMKVVNPATVVSGKILGTF